MDDAGGAIAIKGFNFQKALICLIAVLNYDKDGFSVFVENKEDIEVLFPDSHTFIQAKSTKALSVTKLLKPEKTSGQSILYKNLNKNSNGVTNRYKIAVSSFAQSDKDELSKAVDNCVFDQNVYMYSDEQKQNIVTKLAEQGAINKDIEDKLKRSYLVYFPYSESLDEAIRYIMGCMPEKNICVDNEAGKIALNELALQIDTKSGIVPDENNPYPSTKNITGTELKRIFKTASQDSDRQEILNMLKTANVLTMVETKKVDKELLKIMATQKSLRQNIVSIIGDFSANTDIVKLITGMYDKVNGLGQKETVYAVLIDVIVNRIQDESK
jgi:hypothetical protein